MSGQAVVIHMRGSVPAQDIAKLLQADGIPISSRGKGKALFKAALPVPASGELCIDIPRYTTDWYSAGAAVFAMCATRKCSNVRVVYDPHMRRLLVDPWHLSMTWLAEFCEDLSARLWRWRPIALPWEQEAVRAAQNRLISAMQRWHVSSPALFRLASQAESEGNLDKLQALCHAEAIKSSSDTGCSEADWASCRIVQMGLAVNPSAPVAFKGSSARIVSNLGVKSAVEELMQTKHDDLKSAAIGAAALLKLITDSR
jgi:hypothetical protein